MDTRGDLFRKKPRRPRTLDYKGKAKSTTVYISDEYHYQIKELGEGSFIKGIKILVDFWDHSHLDTINPDNPSGEKND